MGSEEIFEETVGLMDNIEFGFDTLAALTGGAMVHRGIYTSNKPGIAVYTVIGGLTPAKEWFDFAQWVPKEYVQ